jgi:hypothetical protein
VLRRRKSGYIRVLSTYLLILALVLAGSEPSQAYSVLTHEAIVDSAWDEAIRPLLLKRFPNSTPDELATAHGYAYGGCAIQDLGYYPFGSKFFSDLVHYVRTGDFIEALLRDSQDLDEFAFALGALAHYAADNNGHRIAVNRAVGLLYPKLKRKYGDEVTYAENPAAHLKTEFGFDVLQIAKGHYAPDAYRNYIGFQVSQPLLERAFEETYSIELKSVLTNFDLAVGSYRRGVGFVIPEMTRVAWETKKDDIQKDIPVITKQKFLYHLSRASYEKEWDNKYQKPGTGARFLALVIRFAPKIGPLKALSFRTPTPEAEKMFMASFNATVKEYEELIHEERESGRVALRNDNFDTGTVTAPGEYSLADKAYAELLDRLAKDHFAQASPEIRATLLDYYSNLQEPFTTKKNKNEWAKVLEQVNELKGLTTSKGAM